MTGRIERLEVKWNPDEKKIAGSVARVADDLGDLVVYQRMWSEPGLRKFVVIRESSGLILADFIRKDSAIKWAKDHAFHGEGLTRAEREQGFRWPNCVAQDGTTTL